MPKANNVSIYGMIFFVQRWWLARGTDDDPFAIIRAVAVGLATHVTEKGHRLPNTRAVHFYSPRQSQQELPDDG
jgi:hypothetical protein